MRMPPVAEELFRRRLNRITSEEHVLQVMMELAARARRRWEEVEKSRRAMGWDESTTGPAFKSGLAAGYVQAVQLLLDCSHEQTLELVREWL